jgi:hypothetical protein
MSTAQSLEGGLARSPNPRAPRRWKGLALIGLAVVVVVLVASQLILPSLASRLIRESLEPQDRGVSVSVSSFPALGLLFGHADSATVHIVEARSGGTGSLEQLLARVGHVGNLNATAQTMHLGPLELSDVSLSKHGSDLTARATVTRSAIEHVLPFGLRIDATNASGGLRLILATTVLGQRVMAGALLTTRNGALEVAPELPVLDLINVPVFNDPRLRLTSIVVHASRSGAYVFGVRGRFV